MIKLKRIFEVGRAWDKTDPDPSKNYGIHGVDIRMVLKGEHGAVQFVIFTNRHLKRVQRRLVMDSHIPAKYRYMVLSWSGKFPKGKELEQVIDYQKWLDTVEFQHKFMFSPMAADLGYHSPVPMWDGQTRIGETRMRDILDKWKLAEDLGIGINSKSDITLPEPETVPEAELPICQYLGVPCYYDGSGLNAERVYKILIQHGEEAVWKYLEDYYNSTFDVHTHEDKQSSKPIQNKKT